MKKKEVKSLLMRVRDGELTLDDAIKILANQPEAFAICYYCGKPIKNYLKAKRIDSRLWRHSKCRKKGGK